MKKVIIVAGLALLTTSLAYYFTKQYELVNSWDFKIIKIRLLRYTTQSTTLTVSIKITNPSAIEAEVSKLNGSVTVNGDFIGNIYQTNVMPIPAQGYNIIELDVAINNANTVNQLLSITGAGTDGALQIRIVGTLLVKSGFVGITVPIDDTESYTLVDLLQG